MGVLLVLLIAPLIISTTPMPTTTPLDLLPTSVPMVGLGDAGSISTKKSAQGAQPGQDQARGLPRARTPSVSTSTGPTTKTSAANWGRPYTSRWIQTSLKLPPNA